MAEVTDMLDGKPPTAVEASEETVPLKTLGGGGAGSARWPLSGGQSTHRCMTRAMDTVSGPRT